jgi:hypothetical protein
MPASLGLAGVGWQELLTAASRIGLSASMTIRPLNITPEQPVPGSAGCFILPNSRGIRHRVPCQCTPG